MTVEKLPQVLKNKISFVEGLSKAVANKVSGIESLDYVVAFPSVPAKEYCIAEYLVVHYRGGAVQARNCLCNSNAAILEELAKMVYSSQVYPTDTEAYKKLISEDAQYDYDIYDHESI